MGAEPRAGGSRRDRLRAEMVADIREQAYAQLAAGGPESLSLNAIAKALGVSGPALYRYVASRDELLATLVTESWDELADTMEAAARSAHGLPAPDRLRAEAAAYRGWALANPHRYRLLNGSRVGTGVLDPERIVPAAHRTMIVVLASLAELAPASDGGGDGGGAGAGHARLDPELERQLRAGAASRPGDAGLPPAVLLQGVLAQTRIHGILSLEIEGYFAQLGLDGALLFDVEIDRLIG